MFGALLGFIGLGGIRTVGWFVVGLAVAGAFSSGMYVQRRLDTADMADTYAEHNRQLRAAVQRAIDQAEQIQADNDEVLATAWLSERRATDDYIKVVRGITHAEPDACTDRPFPADRRRLLDLARTGDTDPGKAVPGTAGAPVATSGTAAAVISYEDEQLAHADCGRRYRELMGRYNALIDWHEKQRAGSQ